MTKKTNENILLAIAEAEKYIEFQMKTLDNLRDHGKTVLNNSVFISLLIVLGSIGGVNRTVLGYLIIVLGLLYAWIFFRSSLASAPKNVQYPLEPEDKITTNSKRFSNEQLTKRYEEYIEIIKNNKLIIKERIELGIEISSLLVFAIVIIIATLGLSLLYYL